MNARSGMRMFGDGLVFGAKEHTKKMIGVAAYGLISPICIYVGYDIAQAAPTVGVTIMVGGVMALPTLGVTLPTALAIECVLLLAAPVCIAIDGFTEMAEEHRKNRARAV